MRLTLLIGGGLALAIARGQATQTPTFEVASVKPAPPTEPHGRVFFGPPRGGPGTQDPERIAWSNAALSNILTLAYDIPTFQLIAPDWLSTERYDIAAKVPEGATKEQVRVMWQNLLKERFRLVLHHESKEFQVDELTVTKGGPKLKPTELAPDAEPFNPAAGPPKLDKNGALELNGAGLIIFVMASPAGATARMTAKGQSLADFSKTLGQQLRHPVIDKTGLSGKYDFNLEYTPDLTGMPPPLAGALQPPGAATGNIASDPGSTIVSALEKQLGLKLSASKAKLDVIVVDHVERIPTEN